MGLAYAMGGTSMLLMALLFSVVINAGAYWFSDKMVLAGTGAQEISKSDDPQLFADTKELADKMGLPMPKLYVMNDPQPNAFATGRNPNNGVVCVSTGLQQLLDRGEVRGVLAHELAHIKNYDILTSSIAAVVAGAVSNIANIFVFFAPSSEDGPNPLVSLAMLILSPIIAMIIQFAISRTREYEADATAAEYTGAPQDLASALQKIEAYVHQRPMHNVNPAYNSLFIQNPISGQNFAELFSTHPATEKRVKKLMNMNLAAA